MSSTRSYFQDGVWDWRKIENGKHIFHSYISVGNFGAHFTRTFHLFGIFRLVEAALSFQLYSFFLVHGTEQPKFAKQNYKPLGKGRHIYALW